MHSLRLFTSIVICAGLVSGSAFGQPGPAKTPEPSHDDEPDRSGLNCPPGSWTCPEEAPSSSLPALPAESDVSEQPGPEPAAAPPLVAYGPVDEQPPGPTPLPIEPARRRTGPEWGAQLRLEGMAMDDRAADSAGMGGFGLSLRPRPTPHFAIDCGVDFLAGIDYRGYRRDEAAFLVNPMVFINPRNKVQAYLLGGVGFSWAKLDNPGGPAIRYSYVGIDAGAGVEWRFSRHMAFGGDLIWFVRGRTDPEASRQPEFVDRRTGRTTNTSVGVLARIGLTFYW
jgi:hypothetical protein